VGRLIAAFLRHGIYCQPADVPSAHLPHPLTEEGRRQAAATATLLSGWAAENSAAIDPVIDCSELRRAYETATILAEELTGADGAARQVASFAALNERSLGAAANLTATEIERIVADDPRFAPLPENWKSDSTFCLPLPGAESMMAAGARAAQHVRARIDALARTAQQDTVKVFVGHGGAFRHAAAAFGLFDTATAQSLSMFHARPVFLERLPDGSWRHVGGDWRRRVAVAAAAD
jgi:2,3-bisphosphoglycerate-dependent phosphoglycerate mutase